MAKPKGLAVIDGFAAECIVTGATENVLRVRMTDGSFCGDISVEALMKLLSRKHANVSQTSKAQTQTTEPTRGDIR